MNHAQALCENVKAILEARKISIRSFAEQISIPASSLTDNLKSKKGLPVDVAIRVADALGFTVEELSKNTVDELLHTKPAPDTSPKLPISLHEQRLIVAYRNNPAMQAAIDKLLGLDMEDIMEAAEELAPPTVKKGVV